MTRDAKNAACIAAREALKRLDPDNQILVDEEKLEAGTYEYFMYPYGWVSAGSHQLAVRKMAQLMIAWRDERGMSSLPHLRAAAAAPVSSPAPAAPPA
jgi:hypothetical protein